MLTFDATVSGDQVGNALANYLEEAGYALVALAENLREGDTQELVEYVEQAISTDKQKVALKALAGLILAGCK